MNYGRLSRSLTVFLLIFVNHIAYSSSIIEESKDLVSKKLYTEIVNDGRHKFIANLKKQPKEYLQHISCFFSHLLKIAADKNQGFEEGTFLIQDPDGAIHDFFSNHPHAYDRNSSHLIGYYKRHDKSKFGKNTLLKEVSYMRGLDLVDDSFLGKSINPTGKRHLLFSRVGDYTFIKPENWGTSIVDVLPHSYEFVIAQMRINSFFRFFVEKHDDLKYRNERIPFSILEQYEDIIALQPNKNELLMRAKDLGIHNMVSVLYNMKDNKDDIIIIDESTRSKAINLLQEIESEYDHLDVRIGREVIIDQEDLREG